MKMQTTPRVEPTFGDAPPPAAAPEAAETAWPEAGAFHTELRTEPHTEPQMAPPSVAAAARAPAPAAAAAVPPAVAAAPADADAPAAARPAASAALRALPVKTMAWGGAAAAGLIGAIVWIGNAAQEQRHRPPEPASLAAPAGMSAKALPPPEVQTIAPVSYTHLTLPTKA